LEQKAASMTPEAPSDNQLMERLRDGDRAAGEVLFSRHYQRVLNIVWRHLGRQSEAEDLAQEVFLRVYKAAHRWEPRALFTTWLFQITANLCFNFTRDRRRRGRVLSIGTGQPSDTGEFDPVTVAPDKGAISAEEQVEQSETARAVREALDELPERQRLALVMMHFGGLGHAEIAEAIGSNANAVKQMCHRGRDALREKLRIRLKDEQLVMDAEDE